MARAQQQQQRKSAAAQQQAWRALHNRSRVECLGCDHHSRFLVARGFSGTNT
jgi:hypothetical protein